MNKILLIAMLALSIQNYSQVAVTPSARGDNDEFGRGELEKFKSTTTIFVLPQLNKKEDYEKILEEVWTVTPYKVVEYKDFKMLDYADGTYSIANFDGDIIRTGKGTMYLHTNFSIRTLNKEKFDKRFGKLKSDDEDYSKKISDVFRQSLNYISRVPLSVNNKFLRDGLGSLDFMKMKFPDKKMAELYNQMYTEPSFTNTNLGMLKNYFQEINQIISKSEHCGLYDDFVKPEIKNLKEATLYIPDVYLMKYDSWRLSEKLRDEKEVKKLLEDYKYKFQFIKDEDLQKKILDNEDIYYLRYVSMNANKYLQVVNAKTGSPAYYFYGAATYNLKDDDFEKISKAVAK